MSSAFGARYGNSATFAVIACMLLKLPTVCGDQVNKVHVAVQSATMRRLPQVELDDGLGMEDGLIDHEALAAYQEGWAGDRKSPRVRSIPAASTIMRRHAEAAPYFVDEAPESEALLHMQRPIRPHAHSSSQLSRTRPKHFPKAIAAPAPAPLPGNVELTLSWRAPEKELPALLAEVARVQKQEQNSDIGSTPAPASDQDIDIDQDIEKAPSPMPVPSGDDSTKGLPLFIATVIFLCCLCGTCGSCIYYLCVRRGPASTSSASAPLVGNQAESGPTRSYRERRKKGDKDTGENKDGGNNDEGTKGETGGSSGDTGAKKEEPAPVEEEEEQHF
jgi:hypothetical protein